ncbi:DUF4974 domain-containing protein [Chitinophaga lutea]|uniref:DUF4974 domain-containing protein n=1 Tax=Chitinophaga lutea TaxID=2488634 RepID=A0A3N4PFX8_9BACT|nr:FecR domain-containing protein [Chitinophaga lutea]RPE05419.1 DUF4974 domain-containing protein [Chitinophaga lutea]
MDTAYFLEILQKYREGTASPEEEQFLLASYEAFESQPDIVALLTDAERERLKSTMHAGIMEQIARHEGVPARPRRAWLKAAAAAAVLAGGVATILLWPGKEPAAPAITANQQNIQPEHENNFIALPDGSSVLVSAGSRLQYPASFEGGKREVYLEGKALFTVQQQSSRPFIVHTGALQTTVLGTTFEINAPATGDITVTVLNGRVQVASETTTLGVLSANEQMIYNTASRAHQQLQLATPPQPAWQQQDLLFDDVTLRQAAGLLEERFDVHISIPDETLQQQRFTTTFAREESLEQVLKSICDFNHAAYKKDKENNTIIIYRP